MSGHSRLVPGDYLDDPEIRAGYGEARRAIELGAMVRELRLGAGLGRHGEMLLVLRPGPLPPHGEARPHGLRVLIDNALAQLGVTARVELEVDAMPSTLSLVGQGVS